MIFRSRRELYRAAASRLVKIALGSVREHGRFALVLSGGETPAGLFREMVRPGFRRKFPWNQTHFFWVDERWVKRESPESNFGAFERAVLKKARIPPQNLHPIDTTLSGPEHAARRYERELKRFWGPGIPSFDLVILGVGTDGHTASLFPGSPALRERKRLAAAVPKCGRPPLPRVTLTLPVLEKAREVMFLVTGRKKREIMTKLFFHPGGGPHPRGGKKRNGILPVTELRKRARLVEWFLDREAFPPRGWGPPPG